MYTGAGMVTAVIHAIEPVAGANWHLITMRRRIFRCTAGMRNCPAAPVTGANWRKRRLVQPVRIAISRMMYMREIWANNAAVVITRGDGLESFALTMT